MSRSTVYLLQVTLTESLDHLYIIHYWKRVLLSTSHNLYGLSMSKNVCKSEIQVNALSLTLVFAPVVIWVKSLRSTTWSSLTYDLLIWTDDCNLWCQSTWGNTQYFSSNCWCICYTPIAEVVNAILHRSEVGCVVWWCPWHLEPGIIPNLYWSREFHVGGSSGRIGEVLGERVRGGRGMRDWEVKIVRIKMGGSRKKRSQGGRGSWVEEEDELMGWRNDVMEKVRKRWERWESKRVRRWERERVGQRKVEWQGE